MENFNMVRSDVFPYQIVSQIYLARLIMVYGGRSIQCGGTY